MRLPPTDDAPDVAVDDSEGTVAANIISTKIVKTNNTSVLDWSSSTGNPGNKLTYLVTDGLSHSDGTTGDAANSGKTSGVLTYIVPSTVDANFNGNDNFDINVNPNNE